MSYLNHSLDIDDSIKDVNLQRFCLLRSIRTYLKAIESSSKMGAICSTQMGSISRFPRTEFPVKIELYGVIAWQATSTQSPLSSEASHQ